MIKLHPSINFFGITFKKDIGGLQLLIGRYSQVL
jgi:hypothetical protein